MAIEEVKNGGAAAKVVAEVTFTAVKPQLVVEAPKAADAVVFYKSAFEAEEVGRTTHSKRKADQELPLVLSAQLKLAGTTILVSDSTEALADSAKTVGSGFMLCLETEDVEAAMKKAVSAGAVAVGEISEGGEDACGGRVGKVQDPYGYFWLIYSPEKKLGEAEA